MATTYNQNFDPGIGTAIPLNWTGDPLLYCNGTAGRSGTKALGVSWVGAFPSKVLGNYGVPDLSKGAVFEASLYVFANPSAASGQFDVGLLTLGNDSPITSSSSFLWFGVRFDGTAGRLVVLKYAGGVETVVHSVVNSDSRLAPGEYYKVHVQRDEAGLFDVDLTRNADGWMMNAAGEFVNGTATAVSGLSVPSPPSGQYYGVGFYSNSSDSIVYADDFSVTTEWDDDSEDPEDPGDPEPSSIPPRWPLIVPIPHQYYHPD